MEKKFILQDSIRRSCDKWGNLRQKTSVSSYQIQLRNPSIGILLKSEDEKLDIFCAVLKTRIRFKVSKGEPKNVEKVARIALNVDCILLQTGEFSQVAYLVYRLDQGLWIFL